MSTTVAPDHILKELAALWTQEGKQGDAGVLRACSMTLLVVAEAAEDAGALGDFRRPDEQRQEVGGGGDRAAESVRPGCLGRTGQAR